MIHGELDKYIFCWKDNFFGTLDYHATYYNLRDLEEWRIQIMINLKDEYIVIADGFIKFRGNFRACQQWCNNFKWMHDAFKELIIAKVVADGKAI